MIGKVIRGRGFSGLMKYLTAASKALTPDHLEARNIVSIERAAKEMRVVADQSERIQKPVYHLILAWAREESPTRAKQIAAAERLLELIGLAAHQALIVVHDEPKAGLAPGEDGRHYETHICVNRVRFDGRVAKLARDYSLVEKAAFRVAGEFGFAQIPGRFNKAAELEKPGLGDAIGSIKAQSGEKTIADEIRQDARRFDALRAARCSGWAALLAEFRHQGIGLTPGPAPRRADLDRGIVMVDLSNPQRRLKISALDSSGEKWGAGALIKELGPVPPDLSTGIQPELSGKKEPTNSALQTAISSNAGRYQQFLAEKEKALSLRSETLERHASERAKLVQARRDEQSRLYANAKQRRQILYKIFGRRRSLLRNVLNIFFDAMSNDRRRQMKDRYDRLWAELRLRQSNERISIPRWAEWRRGGAQMAPSIPGNLESYRRSLVGSRGQVSGKSIAVGAMERRPGDRGR